MSKKQTIIRAEGKVTCTGRFRAIVHTGHEYDDEGNIVRRGTVLRETPFGRNTITLAGFNRMLSGSSTYVGMVAGSGNATPNEADTALQSYLGKYDTKTSVVTTRNSDSGAGPLFWRSVFTGTFSPGAFGVSPVNISEAGIVMDQANISGISGSSTVGARGLLVDGVGSPTSIAVQPDEYLDLVWEYTEWLPYDAAGVVSLTIDGTPTNHDYAVRPSYLDNVGGASSGWADTVVPGGSSSNFILARAPAWFATDLGTGSGYNTRTAAAEGPLGAPSGPPGGTFSSDLQPTSMTAASYTTDSKNRSVTLSWAPANGNVGGGIGAVNIILSHTQWQVSFDPKIAKINTKQLVLTFNLALANA